MTTRSPRFTLRAHSLAAALAITAALHPSPSQAQVIVESDLDLDFGVATSPSTPGTATLSQSFTTTTASNSVLLLLVGAEPDQSQTADATATFGAQNFTLVASSPSGTGFVRRAFVFALDLGNETAETANIGISLTVANSGQGFGAAVMQVSNASFASLQATAGSSGTSPFGSTFMTLPSGSVMA